MKKVCNDCKVEYKPEFNFCGQCGKKLVIPPPKALPPQYNTSYGYWKVTTEGDCEGRTTTQLGVYKGFIDEIARKLAHRSMYKLNFQAVDVNKIVAENEARPPAKVVHIQLDINSKTWDLSPEQRVMAIAKVFENRPVEVGQSNLYGSVMLEFKD